MASDKTAQFCGFSTAQNIDAGRAGIIDAGPEKNRAGLDGCEQLAG